MPDPCPKCGAVHEKCKAHTRAGRPCRGTVMAGQRVCRMHGGSSPQCINKARERLAAMVDPALAKLRKLINSKLDPVSLAAVRDILDRNGLAEPARLDVDLNVNVNAREQLLSRIAQLAAPKSES